MKFKVGDRVQLTSLHKPTGIVTGIDAGELFMNGVMLASARYKVTWDDGETGTPREEDLRAEGSDGMQEYLASVKEEHGDAWRLYITNTYRAWSRYEAKEWVEKELPITRDIIVLSLQKYIGEEEAKEFMREYDSMIAENEFPTKEEISLTKTVWDALSTFS